MGSPPGRGDPGGFRLSEGASPALVRRPSRRTKRNPGLEHPTVKPTEVFAIPMRVHTSTGDICYEPFSGSGSQIIAAERLNLPDRFVGP